MGVKFQYHKLKLFYKTVLKRRIAIDSDAAGSTTKPFHYKVNFRDLTNYSAAVFDDNPIFYNRGKDTPAAHPLFPVRISWQMVENLDSLWDAKFPVDLRSNLIHQSEYIQILQPLHAGDDLSVIGTLISLVPHKLGVKLTICFDYNERQKGAMIKEYVSAILLGVKCDDGGKSIEEIPQSERIEINSGSAAEKVKISALASYIYDGCTDIVNPIHTDREYARSLGLPGIILQGTATLAMSVSAVLKAHGADPRKVETAAGKFSGYVQPPDNLTVRFMEKEQGVYYFETLNKNNDYVIRGGYIKVK